MQVGKQANIDVELLFIVEPSGVCHQQLYNQGQQVSVVLASRDSYFGKTLKVRTVTDRTTLTQMGLKKNLDRWNPPEPLFSQPKQQLRERKRLKGQITRHQCQRHATGTATGTPTSTLERMDQHLQLSQQQMEQMEAEIKILVDSDEQIKTVCVPVQY